MFYVHCILFEIESNFLENCHWAVRLDFSVSDGMVLKVWSGS